MVGSHSEKEGAAGTYKGGYGFHPMMAYCDETGEALAAILRPGNAGSNTAADHVEVIEDALAQIPTELIETIEIVVRADSAHLGQSTSIYDLGGGTSAGLGDLPRMRSVVPGTCREFVPRRDSGALFADAVVASEAGPSRCPPPHRDERADSERPR